MHSDRKKLRSFLLVILGSFSAARNKLSYGKGNLVRQVEQIKELGAQTSKKIPKELSGDPEV